MAKKRTSTEKGRDFELRVLEILKLKRPIEITHDIMVENRQCDIYAVFHETWGNTHYYISCKDYESGVGAPEVDAFNSTFSSARNTNPRINRGMLISSNHFTAEAKAKGEKLGLILKTLKELEGDLLDLTAIFTNNLTRYEQTELVKKNLYIPLTASIKERERNVIQGSVVHLNRVEDHAGMHGDQDQIIKMDTFLENWIEKNRGPQLLILLGDYGTGKTTTIEHFYHNLVRKYLDEGPGVSRIPILMRLKDFKKEMDLKRFIHSLFSFEYGMCTFQYPVFENFNAAGKFIFILDAFDEMATQVGPHIKEKNFRELIGLLGKNSRIVITSRTHYFTSDKELKIIMSSACDNKDGVSSQVLFLNPLTPEDIDQYLRKMELDPGLLRRNMHLNDICTKPLLLDLVVKTIGQAVSRADLRIAELFRIYALKWLIQSDDRARMSREQRFQFCKELALYFLETGINKIHFKEFPARILSFFPELKREDDIDYYERDVETSTFLERSTDGFYFFNHTAFYEFFVAEKLIEMLSEGKTRQKFEKLFSGSLLTKEIIHFLRDLIDIDNLEPKLETKDFKSFISNEFNPGAGNEIIAWFLQLSSKESRFDFSILISGGIYCPRCLDLSELDANDAILQGLLGNLSNPEKVEELNLKLNQITEIKGLDKFINLKSLDLDDNQITEIKGLEKLVCLNRIELCYNQITEIKGLDNLVELSELMLFHNRITEIKGLDRLSSLDTLDLNDNQITEIKGLEKLGNLNYLDLSHNRIAEIKGLNKLPILANLYLEENRISIIECIEHLTELTLMSLRGAIINISDPFDDLIFLLLDTELQTKFIELERLPALKIFNF